MHSASLGSQPRTSWKSFVIGLVWAESGDRGAAEKVSAGVNLEPVEGLQFFWLGRKKRVQPPFYQNKREWQSPFFAWFSVVGFFNGSTDPSSLEDSLRLCQSPFSSVFLFGRGFGACLGIGLVGAFLRWGTEDTT